MWEPLEDVVVVVWEDAFIETDDFDNKKARKTKPVVRSTVGYYVCQTDKGIVLATDKYETEKDGFAARMFVPWGLVIDWYDLQAK